MASKGWLSSLVDLAKQQFDDPQDYNSDYVDFVTNGMAKGVNVKGPMRKPKPPMPDIKANNETDLQHPQPKVGEGPIEPPWWMRPDGTVKGEGFLGTMKRPDGWVMSEYSTGSPDITGQELDYPTMVPTLNRSELEEILTTRLEKGKPPPRLSESILRKAADHARKRVLEGKGVFADPGESQYHIFPDIPRENVPTEGFNDAVIKPTPSHENIKDLLHRLMKTR